MLRGRLNVLITLFPVFFLLSINNTMRISFCFIAALFLLAVHALHPLLSSSTFANALAAPPAPALLRLTPVDHGPFISDVGSGCVVRGDTVRSGPPACAPLPGDVPESLGTRRGGLKYAMKLEASCLRPFLICIGLALLTLLSDVPGGGTVRLVTAR